MANVTISLPMKAETNRPFKLEATGSSRTDALGEFEAKKALTVGTADGDIHISDVPTSGEQTAIDAVAFATGPAGNVVFTLKKTGVRAKVLRMTEVTSAIANADGTVNTSHALVTALGTAYSDGSGAKGYTITKGRFTRK